MKIFAISDMHGKLDGLDPSGCDVVVIAGDFAPLKGFSKWHIHDQRDWINRKFMAFAGRYPDTQFVIVPGNHDLCLDACRTRIHNGVDYSIEWAPNTRLLIDEKTTIDGISFYGSPWIPVISGKWAFEADYARQKEMFSKIPGGVDVLITHSPPHLPDSYIDQSTQYGMSPHFGSDALASAIFEKKPRYSFCGHIHSGYHEAVDFNGTKLYNVAYVDEDYIPSFNPRIIEIERADDEQTSM